MCLHLLQLVPASVTNSSLNLSARMLKCTILLTVHFLPLALICERNGLKEIKGSEVGP